jgi:acetyl-CoA acetyltransferase family protein
LTAELLAQNYNVSRLEQDQYTVLTNARYFKALESGFFNKEMIEILVDGMNISTDEQPRESNIDNLSFLSTPFKKNGTVTAANSSGIGDGACVGLLCDHESLAKHNWDPLAKIVKTVNIGLEPERMGLGPIYAIQKLFEITGLSADDIDLFEINEAFAVQMIICRNELGLQDEKVNIHGGAVAMGHPLGMSGLRVISTLAHSLKARNERYGIASMCVGHGQGVAMLLENS